MRLSRPTEELKQEIVCAVAKLFKEHGAGNQITLASIRSCMTTKIPDSTLRLRVNLCIAEGLIYKVNLGGIGKGARPVYSYRPSQK